MDLLEFVTVLLYDYEMLYCVLAFTFLMCFWELNIWLVDWYIISVVVCYATAIMWYFYQRVQVYLHEQCEFNEAVQIPFTDRDVQHLITEMWEQLLVEVHSAPPTIQATIPDVPIKRWWWDDYRCTSSHIHQSNFLSDIPLVTTFDSQWSTPFVSEFRGWYLWGQEIQFPLWIQSLAQRCIERIITNAQGSFSEQCMQQDAFIEYEVQDVGYKPCCGIFTTLHKC